MFCQCLIFWWVGGCKACATTVLERPHLTSPLKCCEVTKRIRVPFAALPRWLRQKPLPSGRHLLPPSLPPRLSHLPLGGGLRSWPARRPVAFHTPGPDEIVGPLAAPPPMTGPSRAVAQGTFRGIPRETVRVWFPVPANLSGVGFLGGGTARPGNASPKEPTIKSFERIILVVIDNDHGQPPPMMLHDGGQC